MEAIHELLENMTFCVSPPAVEMVQRDGWDVRVRWEEWGAEKGFTWEKWARDEA
jgi:hypothetical protein